MIVFASIQNSFIVMESSGVTLCGVSPSKLRMFVVIVYMYM